MKKHKNLLLLVAIVLIILGAFLFAPKGVEYSGTDDAAENAISTIQGSIGAGIIFYVIGYQRGKKHQDK